jgi:glycosyltransferase involved in cell wall biosynthesis
LIMQFGDRVSLLSKIKRRVAHLRSTLNRKHRLIVKIRREIASAQSELRSSIDQELDVVRRSSEAKQLTAQAELRAAIDALKQSVEARQIAAQATLDGQIDALGRTVEVRQIAAQARLDGKVDALGRTMEARQIAAQATLDDKIDALGRTMEARQIAAQATLDDEIDALGRTMEVQSVESRERRKQTGLLEHLISAGPIPYPREGGGVAQDSAQVSIILPVFNRANFVSGAIDSVLAQSLTLWELIVIDDGSDDNIDAVLKPYLSDSRIRLIRQTRTGAASARNAGLKLARGAFVAYIDSDNLWYPSYLMEITRALQSDPQADVAYGVLVSEGHGLDERCLLFEPFNRGRLEEGNYIDLNVVLHRVSLVARYGGFDETLDRLMDWDLLLRYTQHGPAKAVPVLAARYRTVDALRITDNLPLEPSRLTIKKKWYPPTNLQASPRVLYVLWHYPQLSETYIETEILCMRRWGVHIEVWRAESAASPHPTTVRIHTGTLADAVREARPDLIHVHWLSVAMSQERELTDLNIPTTVRMHGFDATAEGLHSLLARPWLRSVYAFPSQLSWLVDADPRVKVIPAVFESGLFRPSKTRDRRMVLRAGPALPSKDLPFFFQMAKRLPDFRFVYAGVTCKFAESYVDELRELRLSMKSPVELMFDLPRPEVADLIGQAGIFLHTTDPPGSDHAHPLGMPVSIAEAMATGAYVLARDAPEFSDYLGDTGELYRDADHAAQLIASTASWTDEDWKEVASRAVLRAYTLYADETTLRPIYEDWRRLARTKRAASG